MSSLHNFNLFCRRKKFSIEKYIKAFPQSSYQEFCDFLVSRSVQPPAEEEFLKFKPVVEEKVEPPKVEEQPRKQRKSRRTKKQSSNNDQILEDN